MAKKRKPAPIVAAGGVVLRGGAQPKIAVVQMRRTRSWVLPKGKLRKGETALEAAKREVREETGYAAEAHEYLGAISYKSGGLPKIAKFWRMEASGPAQKLMHDIVAVRWLPVKQAIRKLTHEREQRFLTRIGEKLLLSTSPRETAAPRGIFARLLAWLRGE